MSSMLCLVLELWSTFVVLLLCIVIPLLVDDTAAQVAIPSTWRKPTVDISRQQSIDIAAAALDKAYDEIVPDDKNPDFNMILAEFDIATNQTRYRDKVANYFLTALAYVAYKDPTFLNLAKDAWDSNNNYVLSSTGVPPAFQSTSDSQVEDALDNHRKCPNAVDLSGGLMYHPRVDMVTSTNALSGLLAQITQNDTYLNAAQQSARLFLSQLYDDDSLFWWQVTLNMSDPCATPIIKRKESWNTGYTLEALAILSSIRQNETINERLTASLSASSHYDPWYDSTDRGILDQTAAIDIVRGFATVLARKESYSSDVSSYVGAYLAVQYNAVLDEATTEGTNIYGNSWIGPPNSTYSVDSQLAAARVLIAGIGLASQPTSLSPPSPSPPSPAETSSPEVKTSHVGAIVGGVLGGLFLIALVVVGTLFIIRRRQHTMSQSTEAIQVFSGSVGSLSAAKPQQSEKRQGRGHIVNPIYPHTHPRSEASTDLSSGSSRSESSTVDLVPMLNQGLQGERWDREEPPPGYSN
ncbi:hypothetical protein VNI00_018457 [Paramarasmius palmivorus]|uniref:Glycoside hydrolase family 76 protein n=1 Tax=Paramarasmius palmivorus TaxID=297713 RepID=A0AAW0B0P5_9AGAR